MFLKYLTSQGPFYLLLDYSLTTDSSNPVNDRFKKYLLKIIDSGGCDIQLASLYFSKNIKDWEDKMYSIVDTSLFITPFASIIGSVKREINPADWQKLTELEYLSYQIKQWFNDSEVGLWD